MVGSWLYIYAIVFTVNLWPGSRLYFPELFKWIFYPASLIGFYLSPFWVAAAIALILSRARQQRTALADIATVILVICLMGLYYLLALFLD